MIIKSLYDYYTENQKEKDDQGNNLFPKYGYAVQRVAFKLALTSRGSFISFEPVSLRIFLPDNGARDIQRTGNIEPNYFYDTEKFLLGSTKQKIYSDVKKLEAFIKLHEEIVDETKSKDLECAVKFLNTVLDTSFNMDPIKEVLTKAKIGGNIILSIEGRLLHEQKELLAYWDSVVKNYKPYFGVCAITGEKQSLKKIHGKIKGIGGSKSGCSLISYNIDAHKSYLKGIDEPVVPIGSKVEFGYRTTLNYLLSSGMHSSRLGSDSVVFWTTKHKDNFICHIIKKLLFRNKEEDSDDTLPKIKDAIECFKQGIIPKELPVDSKFRLAVLSANVGRVFIREFIEEPLDVMAKNVAQHYSDITLEGLYAPTAQGLAWVGISRKSKDTPPKTIYKPLMCAVLKGEQYPHELVLSALSFVLKPDEDNGARLGLIKGYLNRMYRTENKKEFTVGLDKERSNIGYLLGRFLVVADQILIRSIGHGGPNKSYNDRYRGSLGSTPRFVFKDITDKVSTHLSKLKKSERDKGFFIFISKKYSEIIDMICPDAIPTVLNPKDQMEFAIGYQHQYQNQFVKEVKQENTTKESAV